MTDSTPVAGEKETPDGEAPDPARATEVPVQEGQPQKPKARRKRRTQKQAEAVRLNPECTNPACTVTCSPQCPNLIDELQWREYVEAEKTPLEEGVVTSRRLPA